MSLKVVMISCSVRLRSEGFRDAKERDVELSAVLKYKDRPEMYEEIKKGKYHIKILKDQNGREVGRSCLEKIEPTPAKSLVSFTMILANLVNCSCMFL